MNLMLAITHGSYSGLPTTPLTGSLRLPSCLCPGASSYLGRLSQPVLPISLLDHFRTHTTSSMKPSLASLGRIGALFSGFHQALTHFLNRSRAVAVTACVHVHVHQQPLKGVGSIL